MIRVWTIQCLFIQFRVIITNLTIIKHRFYVIYLIYLFINLFYIHESHDAFKACCLFGHDQDSFFFCYANHCLSQWIFSVIKAEFESVNRFGQEAPVLLIWLVSELVNHFSQDQDSLLSCIRNQFLSQWIVSNKTEICSCLLQGIIFESMNHFRQNRDSLLKNQFGGSESFQPKQRFVLILYKELILTENRFYLVQENSSGVTESFRPRPRFVLIFYKESFLNQWIIPVMTKIRSSLV